MKSMFGLIVCLDLRGFSKINRQKSDEEIFNLLSLYYEWVGERVASVKGEVIKFMGDASLIVFNEEIIDEAVRLVLEMRMEGDLWLSQKGIACRHQIRMHYGVFQKGFLGVKGEKRVDIVGTTINTLFLMKVGEVAITPEVFRKLNPTTRQLFKKHTPPISYIPTSEFHSKIAHA